MPPTLKELKRMQQEDTEYNFRGTKRTRQVKHRPHRPNGRPPEEPITGNQDLSQSQSTILFDQHSETPPPKTQS